VLGQRRARPSGPTDTIVLATIARTRQHRDLDDPAVAVLPVKDEAAGAANRRSSGSRPGPPRRAAAAQGADRAIAAGLCSSGIGASG
jgi:hypothetical protein